MRGLQPGRRAASSFETKGRFPIWGHGPSEAAPARPGEAAARRRPERPVPAPRSGAVPLASALAALASDVAALRFRVAAVKLRLALRANFDPNQPRVPRGRGKLSGRWTDRAGAGDPSVEAGSAQDREYIPIGSSDPDDETPEITIYKHPPPLPPLPRPVPGPPPPALPPPRPADGGMSLDEPPHIPERRPSDYRAARRIARKVAIWVAKLALRTSLGPAGHIWTLVEVAMWVRDEFGPEIEAYFDAPKTLAELQENARASRRGYEIHHIVERTAALRDGYLREVVDAPDNLVSIPTFKHWEVTSWFMTPNPEYDGLSPRAYSRGKSWEERRRIGLLGLLEKKVLAP